MLKYLKTLHFQKFRNRTNMVNLTITKSRWKVYRLPLDYSFYFSIWKFCIACWRAGNEWTYIWCWASVILLPHQPVWLSRLEIRRVFFGKSYHTKRKEIKDTKIWLFPTSSPYREGHSQVSPECSGIQLEI
jgi:hypothetical protein